MFTSLATIWGSLLSTKLSLTSLLSKQRADANSAAQKAWKMILSVSHYFGKCLILMWCVGGLKISPEWWCCVLWHSVWQARLAACCPRCWPFPFFSHPLPSSTTTLPALPHLLHPAFEDSHEQDRHKPRCSVKARRTGTKRCIQLHFLLTVLSANPLSLQNPSDLLFFLYHIGSRSWRRCKPNLAWWIKGWEITSC